MKKKNAKKTPRQTIHNYRKEGLDVGPKGKPDPKKIKKIAEEKKNKGRWGSSTSKTAQQWDEAYRKFKAKQMELEYRKSIGELVEVSKVEKEAFRIGRVVRDSLMNVPARVSGQLAAESNQFKIHQILEKEIRQALEGLKNAPRL